MTFKVVKQLNPVGAMKFYMKPNCNICMHEHFMVLNKLCDKRVTVMNKNFRDLWGLLAQNDFSSSLPKQ